MLSANVSVREVFKPQLAYNLLFRQILEMGDAIGELVRVECINASKPLVRSLLECYFQFTYLINDSEERKALQFLYHYEMQLKEYYEKLAFPELGGSFFQKMKNDKLMKGSNIPDAQRQTYIDNIAKIEQTLCSDDYKEIAKEYERMIEKKSRPSGKRGKVRFWYELFDGLTSVDIIAVKLNEAAMYEFIYRKCSSYAHGEDIVHSNLEAIDEHTLGISGLRDLRQLELVTNDAILLLERSISIYLQNKVEDHQPFANRLVEIMKRRRRVAD